MEQSALKQSMELTKEEKSVNDAIGKKAGGARRSKGTKAAKSTAEPQTEDGVKAEAKQKSAKVTRATIAKRQKDVLRKLLERRPYKWNELLDEAVKEYVNAYPEENADLADIKGKFGSNFSLMEETGEVFFEKSTNMCSLKREEEKEKVISKRRVKKAETIAKNKAENNAAGNAGENVMKAIETANEESGKGKDEEKRAAIEESLKKAVEKAETAKKKRVKKEEQAEQNVAQPMPQETKPLRQEAALAPEEQKTQTQDEKPKKRGRKPAVKVETAEENTAEKVVETVAEIVEEKRDKSTDTPVETIGVPARNSVMQADRKPEIQAEKKNVKDSLLLTDFVFLGNASNAKKDLPSEPKKEVKEQEKTAVTAAETMKTEQAQSQKRPQQTQQVSQVSQAQQAQKMQKKLPQRQAQSQAQQTQQAQPRLQTQTQARLADEKLKEEFLKRLRSLSGEYFEYYSVYLLERYSLKSGRRLEGLRISGGKNDGGIDGEIELTDRFGFRETIYIQAKNWDPTKGLADKWKIGETLVQQFVGAATCRQMRDSKRNCRGIFVTTSEFTKDAKDALEVLGEKFIGYDGNDVYETAKECEFGLVKVNGVWQLDEKLLDSDKSFFNMF